MGRVMSKTRSDEAAARENAAAARKRGAIRKEPTVIDWDRAWAGVYRMFAEIEAIEATNTRD